MTGTDYVLVNVPVVDVKRQFVSGRRRVTLPAPSATDERLSRGLDAYAGSVNRRILVVRTLQAELDALCSVVSRLHLQHID